MKGTLSSRLAAVVRGRRMLLSAGALALGLLTMPYLAGAAAAGSYCRTDPTVALSNGVSVTMWATIQTDISNVTGVNYVLHVPKGVTMTSVTYDTTGAGLETVQIVADQSGTHYEDVTTVSTTSTVGVTAYATRRDSTVASKNGNSNSSITLNWCT